MSLETKQQRKVKSVSTGGLKNWHGTKEESISDQVSNGYRSRFLLLEKEAILRDLALLKFKKNVLSGSSTERNHENKDLGRRDCVDKEKKARNPGSNPQEFVSKSFSEFDMRRKNFSHVKKKDTEVRRLSRRSFSAFPFKFFQAEGSQNAFDEENITVKEEKTEIPLSKLLPPLTLPAISSHRHIPLALRQRPWERKAPISETVWKNLQSCRYLRPYKANRKQLAETKQN